MWRGSCVGGGGRYVAGKAREEASEDKGGDHEKNWAANFCNLENRIP